MAHINIYPYFPQLLSDLADIRSHRPAHNGVVTFVLREAAKCLTGVNVKDILNLKHASKYWVLRHGTHHLQTCCGRVTTFHLHGMSEGKLSGKKRVLITLGADVKWNANLYVSYNFSFSIADNVTGGKLRREYGVNDSVTQHTNNFAQKLF